jgi:hypothetical protein
MTKVALSNKFLILLIMALLIIFTSLPFFTENISADLSKSQIESLLFDNTAIPYNTTIPEWTAKWWKWAYSFSGYYNNPLLDPNGTALMKFQPSDEPVFFLSGAYNSVANRTVTIPAGKAILYPVLNAEISFTDFPNAKGEDDLKRALESDLSAATYVGTELNEISLPYHRIKADLFDLSVAKDNIFDVSDGPTQAVADGYWIFLKPLPIGEYTIHIKGEQPFYRSEVTYKINIVNQDN